MKASLNKLVLTIDLEDWFHCLEPDERRWTEYPRRAHIGTDKLLDLLKRTGSKATFFVLGDVALAQPELIEKISSLGHEIGSHGMNHRFVSKQSPSEFQSDLQKSLKILRPLAGYDCTSYRAPYFSITGREMWPLEILRDNGIQIDSSIFPIYNPRYGDPKAHRQPHRILPDLWEWPITTFASPLGNIPIGGGIYFRLLPSGITRAALKRMQLRGEPFLLYLHPWEVDPDQPRVSGGSLWLKFRHYFGLHRTMAKLESILENQSSTTLSERVRQLESEGVYNK